MRPGLSMIVLEARDRIGGRAFTQGFEGQGLDMGCGWLHSADDNVLTAQVEAQGLTLDQTPPPWRTQAFDHEMTPADQAAFGQAFADFDQRVTEAAALFRAGQEKTVRPRTSSTPTAAGTRGWTPSPAP